MRWDIVKKVIPPDVSLTFDNVKDLPGIYAVVESNMLTAHGGTYYLIVSQADDGVGLVMLRVPISGEAFMFSLNAGNADTWRHARYERRNLSLSVELT